MFSEPLGKPALRNDPPAGLAGSHEQDPQCAVISSANAERPYLFKCVHEQNIWAVAKKHKLSYGLIHCDLTIAVLCQTTALGPKPTTKRARECRPSKNELTY